jgi:hypothetical protein
MLCALCDTPMVRSGNQFGLACPNPDCVVRGPLTARYEVFVDETVEPMPEPAPPSEEVDAGTPPLVE